MKTSITVLKAIIYSSFIFTSCGGNKNESDKTITDSIKTVVNEVKPISDSKTVIKAISEKYYIPVDESKSDLIFTINQNLNLELINYKGSFEGKYIDGKVQFDDKNTTLIDFALKGENIILKNQNDIEVEYRVATENELLAGIWYYSLGGTPLRMIFDKKDSWSVPDDPFGTSKGQYKSKGNNTFSILHFMNRNDLPATLTMKDANSFLLTWQGSMGAEKLKHTRSQKGKLQSLNQIFN
jgi:hypothetical protein